MFQQPIGQQAAAAVSKVPEAISQSVKSATQTVTTTLNDFSSKAVSTSSAFLNSNSIIAKLAFIFLVLIGFIILFRLGVRFVAWMMSPSRNPYLVSGLLTGNMNLSFPQDGISSMSIPVERSNNEKSGLEFTWSIWVNLTGLPAAGNYFHIFHKGDPTVSTDPTQDTNNSPGLYVYRPTSSTSTVPDNAHLVVLMSSFDSTQKLYKVDIDNVPLKKWIHIAIRIQNTIMDVYMNGTLSQRTVFQNTVPRQNYGDVHICKPMGSSGSNGFNGYMSDLRYFDRALSVFSINNIVYFGPNLRPSSAASLNLNNTNAYFFDRLWYKAHY